MRVYRISKEKYIRDLSGTGSKLYGGRWNPKGYALLYTSENKSLAVLEVLIHVDQKTIPADLKIISLRLPDNKVEEFGETKFRKILNQEDSNIKFKEEGKKWLDLNQSLTLKVPSILIPGEKNILINPEHELFKEIEIISIEDFVFDERFFI